MEFHGSDLTPNGDGAMYPEYRIPDFDASIFDDLDEDFPLGAGHLETEATVYCPYCAQRVEIALDPGSGMTQEYIEDCEVCCRPWKVSVQFDEEGRATVNLVGGDG
jgi:hypothetical protein